MSMNGDRDRLLRWREGRGERDLDRDGDGDRTFSSEYMRLETREGVETLPTEEAL